MVRQTQKVTGRLESVSSLWIPQIQAYLFRFIELRAIMDQVLAELPLARQCYFIELIAGIDKRIRSKYHGTQDDADGDVESV